MAEVEIALLSTARIYSITIYKADSHCCCLGLGKHLGLDMGHPFLSWELEHPQDHGDSGLASCLTFRHQVTRGESSVVGISPSATLRDAGFGLYLYRFV